MAEKEEEGKEGGVCRDKENKLVIWNGRGLSSSYSHAEYVRRRGGPEEKLLMSVLFLRRVPAVYRLLLILFFIWVTERQAG